MTGVRPPALSGPPALSRSALTLHDCDYSVGVTPERAVFGIIMYRLRRGPSLALLCTDSVAGRLWHYYTDSVAVACTDCKSSHFFFKFM